jgi:hypothetical protein
MANQFALLRLLISSPDDVADERAIIEEVIEEYNKTWGRSTGILLDPIDWEKDVVPGFGSDPQNVVNEQVADRYDIYVGILWTRFGTPTPRAGSGTEEEFNRAYARFQQDPTALRIMFYFSDRSIVPSQQDGEQLTRINQFRTKIAGQGGLYSTYDSLDDFRNQVRGHLARQVQTWGSVWGEPQGPARDRPSPVPDEPTPGAASQEDEPGYLDLVEKTAAAMDEANQAVTRIGESIATLGQDMQTRTANLQAAAGSREPRLVKRLIDSAAEDMNTFAQAIEPEIPRLSTAYENALDTYGKSAIMFREINPADTEPIEQARSKVSELLSALETGRPGLRELRDNILALQRMTTKLNQAKSRAVGALDNLDAVWLRAIDLSRGLLDVLTAALDQNPPPADAQPT